MGSFEKKAVLNISWITAFCLMGDAMLYIVLPLRWHEAGLGSLVEVGVVLSVNRLVRLPLNPLVSRLYRYINLRRGFGLAVILAVLTTASYGFANSFAAWVILRCLWGLSWSLLRLGAYYGILELQADRNRGQLFGVYNGHYRLGSLIGMLLGGSLADAFGIRPVCLLMAALTLCSLPMLFKFPVDFVRSEPLPRSERRSLRSLFISNESIALLALALGSALLYEGLFSSLLSNFTRAHYASLSLFGISLSAAFVAGALQALRWGWSPFLSPFIGKLSDARFNKVSLLIVALCISGMGFLLFPAGLPAFAWIVVTIGILATSTCVSTLQDSIAASIASSHGQHQRIVMTAYTITLDLGAAIGPILAFWTVQQAGYIPLYWGAGIAFAVLAFTTRHSLRPLDVSRPQVQ